MKQAGHVAIAVGCLLACGARDVAPEARADAVTAGLNTVTVKLEDTGGPIVGGRVAVHDRTGHFLSEAATGPNGRVDVAVPEDGMVTIGARIAGFMGIIWDLQTVVAPPAGATLVSSFRSESPLGPFDVTIPVGAPPTAVSFEATMGCEMGPPPSFSIADKVTLAAWPSCIDSAGNLQILLVALDGNGRAIAYAQGAADASTVIGTTVAAGPWETSFEEVRFDLQNVPSNAQITTDLASGRQGRDWWRAATNPAALPSSGATRMRRPTNLGELAEYTQYAVSAYPATGGSSRTVHAGTSPLTPPTLDLASELLDPPRDLEPLLTSGLVRGWRWNRDPDPANRLVAIEATAQWQDASSPDIWTWSMRSAAPVNELHMPELPDSWAEFVAPERLPLVFSDVALTRPESWVTWKDYLESYLWQYGHVRAGETMAFADAWPPSSRRADLAKAPGRSPAHIRKLSTR